MKRLQNTTVFLTEKDKNILQTECNKTGLSKSDIIRLSLKKYFEEGGFNGRRD